MLLMDLSVVSFFRNTTHIKTFDNHFEIISLYFNHKIDILMKL